MWFSATQMQSAMKKNSLTVGALNIIFAALNRPWTVNIYTFMWQDTRLCKCPRKHSSLGLKWKQTAEKENRCNSILDPGSS